MRSKPEKSCENGQRFQETRQVTQRHRACHRHARSPADGLHSATDDQYAEPSAALLRAQHHLSMGLATYADGGTRSSLRIGRTICVRSPPGRTQVANVQIPVNQVAWVPQTRTVQVPVTSYRTAEVETTTRVAMDSPSTATNLASARPLSSGPTATIAARPSTPVRPSTTTSLGGVALENDPPRQATGAWQTPATTGSRY